MPTFALNGATTGEHVDLVTDIRAAGAAGYHAVELRDTKIERYLAGGGTLPALRAALRGARLEVLSLNALEDSTLPIGPAFERVLARTRTFCEWARALECPYVISVPSFLPPGGLPEAEVHARTVAALRQMAAVAAPFGVKVGFEFLGFPTCSVNTLAAARRIVDEVGDPGVGVVIDVFHFYAGGSRLDDLDTLPGDRLFIVHLDDAEPGDPATLGDAHRLWPGDGVIPLQPILARIERLGYRRAYSLELFRPEYWKMDPVAVATTGLAKMRRLFKERT
ncbi:MAG: sugar phosphate isomerase/epimerase [Armatimonadota bacterium]|nr:sugar phosphate isomerase/epimerase [Armatimonadota bacterium]